MIQVANAPCSWGVLEFDGLEGDAAGCEQFLRELKQSGYAGTELGEWGFMPTDPGQLAELLGAHELPLLGAFVPVALADAAAHNLGTATALKTARLVAAVNPHALIVLADDNGSVQQRTQNAGRIRPIDALTKEQWTTFTSGATELARTVFAETGLRTVFHHHCAGWIETPAETARLLEETDPEVLGLCFDTGHWTLGGGDALDGLRKHRERIWHVHFKDCDPAVASRSRDLGWNYFQSVEHGIFSELGKGCVDFAAISEELRVTGYDDWIVVEQDVLPGLGSPLDSAKRNRDYLLTIGL